MFLEGIRPGDKCAIVGASTKDLIAAATKLDAEVLVLDFSKEMCVALNRSFVNPNYNLRLHDITVPVPIDLVNTQDFVLSDRLLNRFTIEEAQRALVVMNSLINNTGEIRASIKLGFYKMDLLMIEEGKKSGNLSHFYDAKTKTIDYSKAGQTLEKCLLPHGEIPRSVLLRWYYHRGKETRFEHTDVLDLIQASLPEADIELRSMLLFPDSPSTTLYNLRKRIICVE